MEQIVRRMTSRTSEVDQAMSPIGFARKSSVLGPFSVLVLMDGKTSYLLGGAYYRSFLCWIHEQWWLLLHGGLGMMMFDFRIHLRRHGGVFSMRAELRFQEHLRDT